MSKETSGEALSSREVFRQSFAKVIEQWKGFWMSQKSNDEADCQNYLHRALGVDANMKYHLAGLLADHADAELTTLRAELERLKTDRDEWKASSVRKFSEIEVLTLEIGRVKGELVFSELQLKTVREQRGDFMVMNDTLQSELESTKRKLARAVKQRNCEAGHIFHEIFNEIEANKETKAYIEKLDRELEASAE